MKNFKNSHFLWEKNSKSEINSELFSKRAPGNSYNLPLLQKVLLPIYDNFIDILNWSTLYFFFFFFGKNFIFNLILYKNDSYIYIFLIIKYYKII